MEVAVTGSAGFLGAAIVNAVIAQGHQVRALVRPGSAAMNSAMQNAVPIHAVQLADGPELEHALRGVDAVIHVAAAMGGDFAKHQTDTLMATTHLLKVMNRLNIRQLIGISSYSVYDYLSMPDGTVLDEDTAIESQPETRSAYAHAKLLQERQYWQFLAQPGCAGVVFRPGIVYDVKRLWHDGLGRALGSRAWLAMRPLDAELPLVHVEDAAAAVALGLKSSAAGGVLINLVESNPPRRGDMLQALRRAQRPNLWIVSLPWGLHRSLAALADWLNRSLFGRRLPLPGLLRNAELACRFKPLRYTNARARQLLGWVPRFKAIELAGQPRRD